MREPATNSHDPLMADVRPSASEGRSSRELRESGPRPEAAFGDRGQQVRPQPDLLPRSLVARVWIRPDVADAGLSAMVVVGMTAALSDPQDQRDRARRRCRTRSPDRSPARARWPRVDVARRRRPTCRPRCRRAGTSTAMRYELAWPEWLYHRARGRRRAGGRVVPCSAAVASRRRSGAGGPCRTRADSWRCRSGSRASARPRPVSRVVERGRHPCHGSVDERQRGR